MQQQQQQQQQHIIVLMDISYSMEKYSQNMINGLNRFVESLRARQDHSNVLFSVMLFCDKCSYLCRGIPVDDLVPFCVGDLPQFGTTSLYDAIGKLIQEWIGEVRAQHHLFIITDGDDNGSRQVNKQQATQMCEMAVQNNNWTITHCNVDIGKLDCSSIHKVVYDIDNLEFMLCNLKI